MKNYITNIDGTSIYGRSIGRLNRNIKLLEYCKENRKKGILSEVLFWGQVKSKQFFGIDFHRQYIIGNYIADFYVPKLGLIVEIDGISHSEKHEYDNERRHYFEGLGLKMYIINDRSVKEDLHMVMNDLKEFILETYRSE
ncbi:MAG: DUF559 domain-containing protein [Saprospiraceae bacterium]|nr:DUF559 domain-containing protein [Saprospiraceae bacterium]